MMPWFGLIQSLVHYYVLVATKWNLTLGATEVLYVPYFACVVGVFIFRFGRRKSIPS